MPNNDRYYIGSEEILLQDDDATEKLVRRLRQYLDLRNVSVLIGNGASIPLGAPLIWDVRSIGSEIAVKPYALEEEKSQALAISTLEVLLPDGSDPIGIEPFLGVLSNLQSNINVLPSDTETVINGIAVEQRAINALERLLKKWVYKKCNDISTMASMIDLQHHKELFRRFLLRSTSLPRLKIFTSNYDLFVERCLDNLSVSYFDGFVGTIKRLLRNESYHYDLYFPGDTTEGKVSRVDRVVQFYKIHGSINWRRNYDGYHFDVIMDNTNPNDLEFGEVMIYPSPVKLSEMHGYPYSEMFRNFSSHICQPQSVLFTIGYSFRDEHINRIIYQALSIPSFSLIIVVPEYQTPSETDEGTDYEVWRLINKVNSKRILVITGGEKNSDGKYISGAGTIQGFSTKLMPDISEMAIEDKIKAEHERLLNPTFTQEVF